LSKPRSGQVLERFLPCTIIVGLEKYRATECRPRHCCGLCGQYRRTSGQSFSDRKFSAFRETLVGETWVQECIGSPAQQAENIAGAFVEPEDSLTE
jgi:hypothetical protein